MSHLTTTRHIIVLFVAFSCLPISILLLLANCFLLFLNSPRSYRRRISSTSEFHPRRVLITGIDTPQGLRIARAFHETGHHVLGIGHQHLCLDFCAEERITSTGVETSILPVGFSMSAHVSLLSLTGLQGSIQLTNAYLAALDPGDKFDRVPSNAILSGLETSLPTGISTPPSDCTSVYNSWDLVSTLLASIMNPILFRVRGPKLAGIVADTFMQLAYGADDLYCTYPGIQFRFGGLTKYTCLCNGWQICLCCRMRFHCRNGIIIAKGAIKSDLFLIIDINHVGSLSFSFPPQTPLLPSRIIVHP